MQQNLSQKVGGPLPVIVENEDEGEDGTTSTVLSHHRASFIDHQRTVFDELASWFNSSEAIPEALLPVYQYLTDTIIQSTIRLEQKQHSVFTNATVSDGKNKNNTNQSNSATSSSKEASKKKFRILDVGCGTGALLPFMDQSVRSLQQQQQQQQLQNSESTCLLPTSWEVHYTGLDLSPNMIALAQQKYDPDSSAPTTTATTIQIDDWIVSDILDYHNTSFPSNSSVENKFDAIVINGCFGNFLDPRAVMEHLVSHLLVPPSSLGKEEEKGGGGAGGKVFVTHPLGAEFVQQLHASTPETVPHLLPSLQKWHASSKLLLGLPMTLSHWYTHIPTTTHDGHDDSSSSNNSQYSPLYFAELTHVRYRSLPFLYRLRGMVVEGFGRGSKKLGFPTANLGPTPVFAHALESIQPGVYFGWAVLEEEGPRRQRPARKEDTDIVSLSLPIKAVVNVGYSPTFQKQNPTKIVEAHLIMNDHDHPNDDSGRNTLEGDFYHQVLRLQLIGYLRPEIKFSSISALIEQITADREDAAHALSQAPYVWFHNDPFLRSSDSRNNSSSEANSSSLWIGSAGGNATASWESQSFPTCLESLINT